MAIKSNKGIITDGLVVSFDAGNLSSNNTNLQNNTSGEQWIDLCGGIQELYVVNPSKVSYTNAGRGSYIHINPSAGLDGTTTARFEAGKEYGWQNKFAETLNLGVRDYTFEFWINWKAEFATASQTGFFMNMWYTDNFEQCYFKYNRTGDTPDTCYVLFGCGNTGGTGSVGYDIAANPKITEGNWSGWTHYVITRKGYTTNGLKLYLNSTLIDTHTDNLNHLAPGAFNMGRYYQTSTYGPTTIWKVPNCKYGMVNVYVDKALSAAEVLHNYNVNKGRWS